MHESLEKTLSCLFNCIRWSNKRLYLTLKLIPLKKNRTNTENCHGFNMETTRGVPLTELCEYK